MISYLPDLPKNTPELLVDVEAIPTVRGYSGAPSGVTAYSALAAASTGACVVYKLDGGTRVFAGTQSKLYEGSGGTWADVSRGTSYTTGDVKWRFAQFGNTSLAVNKATQLQYSNAGAFADIANAPKAACMESVGSFIVLANCDDTGTGLATGFGDQPNRWWCSPIFAPTTTWAPSVTTQATSGLLVGAPGAITGLKRLGEQIVAYKARAMHVGTYVGSPEVWRWDLVPGEVGAASQEAVVAIGSAHIFVGFENFYIFDGTRPQPIGDGIKETFFASLNKAYAYKTEGIHDSQNQSVWFYFCAGSSTTLNAAIVYNYATKRWGKVTIAAELPVQTVISGVTYDGFGTLYATYADTPAIAYDSPFWQSGAPVLSYIDTSHVLKTLTGTSGSSWLKTGYMGDDTAVSLCSRVRPRYRTKPTTATITPYSVMALGDTDTARAPSSINGDRFDVLQSARWHAFRLDYTGNFEVESFLVSLTGAGNE